MKTQSPRELCASIDLINHCGGLDLGESTSCPPVSSSPPDSVHLHSWLGFVLAKMQTQLFFSQVPCQAPAEASSSQTRQSTSVPVTRTQVSKREQLLHSNTTIPVAVQVETSNNFSATPYFKMQFFSRLHLIPGDWMMNSALK